MILRSDGTSLYLTKDLALAKIKFEQYHVDRSIYVVDVRQSLHFQQAFKIFELWGFPQASKCYHLAYGIVTLPEGTMSSRKGNMVFYLDVVEEAMAPNQSIIAGKESGVSRARIGKRRPGRLVWGRSNTPCSPWTTPNKSSFPGNPR